MNAADYIAKITTLEAQTKVLNEELSQLRKDYLENYPPFKMGDKVLITTPEHKNPWSDKITPVTTREASVSGFRLVGTRITTQCFKIKKDGTLSKMRDYISYGEILTKL